MQLASIQHKLVRSRFKFLALDKVPEYLVVLEQYNFKTSSNICTKNPRLHISSFQQFNGYFMTEQLTNGGQHIVELTQLKKQTLTVLHSQ